MKSPYIAFALSFLLPGAGLWYLGKRACAIGNLVAVLTIGILAATALDEDTFERWRRFIAITCCAGSAGGALAVAQQLNQRDRDTTSQKE
jgi:hypothetical protein